jgi:class 3 adenylate cyclase
VEVLFAPHPSVAARAEERFCTLFPMAAPELRALFVLQPGEQVDASVPVDAGRWKLEAGAGSPRATIDIDDRGGGGALAWSSGGGDVSASGAAGMLALRLENPGQRRVRVHLSRTEVAEDRVLASALTTMPAFRRQMGHQVLSPSLRVAVRRVSILFTDLTGSTALYEQLGDAGAFAFIRDHFDLVRAVTEEHGGVVVKTIGDGAMAAFSEPRAAAACALAALERFASWSRRLELAHACDLKVGAHAGPALVVHSESAGIDYFGATVNMAARAQGQAGPGELVLTAAMAEDPAVEALLVERSSQRRALDAELKGVSGVQRLVCVTARQPR